MAEKIIVYKGEALAYFDGNQSALARFLEISRAAVQQWAPDKPIPEAQALKIHYQKRPATNSNIPAA